MLAGDHRPSWKISTDKRFLLNLNCLNFHMFFSLYLNHFCRKRMYKHRVAIIVSLSLTSSGRVSLFPRQSIFISTRKSFITPIVSLSF